MLSSLNVSCRKFLFQLFFASALLILYIEFIGFSFMDHTFHILNTFETAENIQWNNISTFKQKLSYLQNGEIKYDYYHSEAFWSIPLLNISFKLFSECYSNKWILFYGDSRLRYSFAEWIKMANNSILSDVNYPRNSKCPYNKRDECSVWFRGNNCSYSTCLRDWHSSSLNTGRWTFNSLLTEAAFKHLITSSKQPDIIFYTEGAWAIYKFYNAETKQMELITDNDYDKIIQNIHKNMDYINQKVGNMKTIKIWMSYPECDELINENVKYTKIINQRVEFLITNNQSMIELNWIFFQLQTPSLTKYCEGFHVRDRWTMIENMLITNALCAA